MRRSYAFRLAAAFAGIGIAAAALTAILVNVSFGTRFTSYLHEQQAARQQRLLTGLADSYRSSGGWDPVDLRSLQSLALMDGTLRLVDPQGDTIWDASTGIGADMAAMHREMMGSGRLGPEQRLPIRVGGEVVGTAIVRLPEVGLLPQDETFRSSVNRLLMLGGILGGLAALVVGIVLARRATTPARELTRAARAVAAGERSDRVDFEGPDEFGEMARAFNSMAETIEEEDRLRRSFAADVAHELKNPLTGVKALVQLGLRSPAEAPSHGRLAIIEREVTRMQEILQDYLSFTRSLAEVVPARVDLGPLVSDTLLVLSARPVPVSEGSWLAWRSRSRRPPAPATS